MLKNNDKHNNNLLTVQSQIRAAQVRRYDRANGKVKKVIVD